MANKHKGCPLPREMTAVRRSITTTQYSVRRFVESEKMKPGAKDYKKWESRSAR